MTSRLTRAPSDSDLGTLVTLARFILLMHYTVDVLHPNRGGETGEGWLHIDKEAMWPMRHGDVFGEHGSERAADERCAYLLFYCRTPTET